MRKKIISSCLVLLILGLGFSPAFATNGGIGRGGGISKKYGNFHWKAPVDSSSDLPATASEGDARVVKDEDTIYVYDGTNWVAVSAAETDPIFGAMDTEAELETQLTDVSDVYTNKDFTDNHTNWDTSYGWGEHTVAGYLSAETDPTVDTADKIEAILTNDPMDFGTGTLASADLTITGTTTISSDLTVAGSYYGDGSHLTGAGDPDQNLWETIAGDTGSTAADSTTDTLTIAGGTNATTAMSGDTLTVNVDDVFATKALNNLASVAINTSLLPSTAGSPNLGSTTKWFDTAYLKAHIIFEGLTDDAYETTLSVTDPTGVDKTIELPDATGTVLLDTSIDASSELAAIMDDETGSGALVFGTAPLIKTSLGIIESVPSGVELYLAGDAGISGDLTIGGTATISSDLTVTGTGAYYGDGSHLTGIAGGENLAETLAIGADANDVNITSLADIALDSISPDGDTILLNMTESAEYMQINQTNAVGVENQPLIFINDDRTGVTSSEVEEAALKIDAEGVYALYVADGRSSFADMVDFTSGLEMGDDSYLWLGTDSDIGISYILNGAKDDILLFSTTPSATDSNAWFFYSTSGIPSGMDDHENYYTPTFVFANSGGADSNDYAGVVMGERAYQSVASTHYFDFYAMTGAIDGSVDGTTTELGATFRFGDSPAAGTNATGPGDVIFNDNIEVDGIAYIEGAAILSSDLTLAGATSNLYVEGFGDFSDNNIINVGDIALDTITADDGVGPIVFNQDISVTGTITSTGATSRITFTNSEYIDNTTDDLIDFVGVGGTSDTDLRFDLDGSHPEISSPTSGVIQIAEDVTITEDLTISGTATISSDLTLAGSTSGLYVGDSEIAEFLADGTKIQPNAGGNVELFGTAASVDNGAGGKSLYVHRKAEEFDRYLRFYTDQYGVSKILNNAGNLDLSASSYLYMRCGSSSRTLINDTANGDVVLFADAASGENRYLKQAGYITAAANEVEARWQVTAAGHFELTRENANILTLDIQMPAQISSDLTLASSNFGMSVGEISTPTTPPANNAYIYVDSADGSLKCKFDDGDVVTIATY